MEVIRKRTLTLGVLMCCVGIMGAIAAHLQAPTFKVTEPWMDSKAPTTVDGLVSEDAPRADQETYDTLQPFGIVNRDFHGNGHSYNVMLLASDRRESFHSPSVCLPAQGLVITDESEVTIDTKTHGKIKAAYAELTLPDDPKVKHHMVYMYRVQNRFIARQGNSTFALTIAMFAGPIRGNFDQNTVFYRVISEGENETKEQFLRFVGDFMDAAHESSGGFF